MQKHDQKITSIYYLVSTRNLLNIRYVGKTFNSLNFRLKGHKNNAKKDNTYIKNWIRKETKDGFEIKIFLIEECKTELWEEREKFWIAYYKSIGFKLCNSTEGGQGVAGYKSPKQKVDNTIFKQGTSVKIVDSSNKIIGTFKNIKEATNTTGHSFGTIMKSVNNNKFVYRRFYKFELWDKVKNPDHVNYIFDNTLIFRKLPYIKKPEGHIIKRQPHTEKTKQRLREATINQFKTKGNPNIGRIPSEETKMKIRNSLLKRNLKFNNN